MSYRAYGNLGEDITPTRAELDADERSTHAGWVLTGTAGSALAALLGPANTQGPGVDNTQH